VVLRSSAALDALAASARAFAGSLPSGAEGLTGL
jgi:hypothetical protein